MTSDPSPSAVASPADAKPPMGAPSQDGTSAGAPPPGRRGRRRSVLRSLWPVLVLALAAGAFLWLRETAPTAEVRPRPEVTWPVEAVDYTLGTVRPDITGYGEVMAGSEIDLRALVPGRIVAVSDTVRAGAVVQEGATLLEIDPFDYDAALQDAEASLADADSRLREAAALLEAERALLENAEEQEALNQRTVERQQRLSNRGVAAERALDEAKLALSAATQAVRQREQTIAQFEARLDQARTAVDRARVARNRAVRDLTDTRLTAPFDAFVRQSDAAIGRMVNASDPVATLIRIDRLEVGFQLTDAEYARLTGAASGGCDDACDPGFVGRPVTVEWRAGARTLTFPAEIERVAGTFDPEAGGVTVFARLTEPGPELPLRPGAFVSVRLPDRAYGGVARLPASAVEADGTLWLIQPDGRVTPATAHVVRRLGSDVLVTGDALPPSGRVVARPFPQIGPEVRVTVPDTDTGSDGGGRAVPDAGSFDTGPSDREPPDRTAMPVSEVES